MDNLYREGQFSVLLEYLESIELYTDDPVFNSDFIVYYSSIGNASKCTHCHFYTVLPDERIPRHICSAPFTTINEVLIHHPSGTYVPREILKHGKWKVNILKRKISCYEPRQLTSTQAIFAITWMYSEMGIYNKPTHVRTLIYEHFLDLQSNEFKTKMLNDIPYCIKQELKTGIVKLEDWCKPPCSECVSDGKSPTLHINLYLVII